MDWLGRAGGLGRDSLVSAFNRMAIELRRAEQANIIFRDADRRHFGMPIGTIRGVSS